MRLSNFTDKDIFRSNFKLISLITAVSIMMLFSLVGQTGWAAVITCIVGAPYCTGTGEDDVIMGTTNGVLIFGQNGNDYIIGVGSGNSFLYGMAGNDILIGGSGNDGLYGGDGNDRYDGKNGADTILENIDVPGNPGFVSSRVNNNDIISGGLGNDYIESGWGADRIYGGPGHDSIYPNGSHRDFSTDLVNCGSGTDTVSWFYSGDGDTAINCESATDLDG